MSESANLNDTPSDTPNDIVNDIVTEPGGAVMDMHSATVAEKLRGAAIQTRADLPEATVERVVEVVRKRLADAGIDVPLDDVRASVAAVSG